MFWLGLLLAISYVPGYTGASIPTQWAVLSIVLPTFLWLRSPITLGHKLFALWIGYALISIGWSPNLYSAGWGGWLLFIWALAYHYGTLQDDLSNLWRGLAIGLSLSTAIALAQAFDYAPVELADPNRPAGLFYNSSLFGVLCGLVLVPILANRLWWYAPPLALGLILSGSRGGIVALAVGLTAAYAGRLVALTLVVLAALTLAFAPLDPADAQRLQIWGVVAKSLSLFGHGPGSFVDLFYVRETKLLLIQIGTAHNDPLQLAYEFGFIALIPIALFGMALGRGPVDPTLCAFTTLALFYFPLYTPVTAFIGFAVAGHCLRSRAVDGVERDRSRSAILSRSFKQRDASGRLLGEAIPMVQRTTQ